MRALTGWLALLALATLTFHRATIWHDDVSLWRDAAETSTKPRPWINFASAEVQLGHIDSARSAYFQGLHYAQDRHDTLGIVMVGANMAILEYRDGRQATARAAVREWIHEFPGSATLRLACEEVQCFDP